MQENTSSGVESNGRGEQSVLDADEAIGRTSTLYGMEASEIAC